MSLQPGSSRESKPEVTSPGFVNLSCEMLRRLLGQFWLLVQKAEDSIAFRLNEICKENSRMAFRNVAALPRTLIEKTLEILSQILKSKIITIRTFFNWPIFMGQGFEIWSYLPKECMANQWRLNSSLFERWHASLRSAELLCLEHVD